MFYNNQSIGETGERVAARYLQFHFYRVLTRNYRTPFGEIDLVCHKRRTLIFVEVKTRTNTTFGNPETAITPQKMSHLIKAGEYYRRQQHCADRPWRIDVLAINTSPDGRCAIHHFENVIQDWPEEKIMRG